MTKMPDKIYAVGGGHNAKEYIVASAVRDNFYAPTEYTRSDLIPQAVTDEARAKALEWFNDCEFFENHFIRDKDRKQFIDTIKAALSHPIPAQTA